MAKFQIPDEEYKIPEKKKEAVKEPAIVTLKPSDTAVKKESAPAVKKSVASLLQEEPKPPKPVMKNRTYYMDEESIKKLEDAAKSMDMPVSKALCQLIKHTL